MLPGLDCEGADGLGLALQLKFAFFGTWVPGGNGLEGGGVHQDLPRRGMCGERCIHPKARVSGFVAPGFEEVRAEFERNFEERGEIGAAVAAYWRGEKVVDLWVAAARPRAMRLGTKTR